MRPVLGKDIRGEGTAMTVESLTTNHEEHPARTRHLRHPPPPGLRFDPRCYRQLIPDGENGNEQVHWAVTVTPHGHVITRNVYRNGAPWNQCGSTWQPDSCHAVTEDLVIWPAWPAKSHDQAAAAPSPSPTCSNTGRQWKTPA
jgi:hypothetical protein